MTNRTTSLTLAALVVATIATAAVPAFAESPGNRDQHAGQQTRDNVRGPGPRDGAAFGGHWRGGQRGGAIALTCHERGGDRLEHVLLSIAQRTTPTTEQQPLYDTLKTVALDAQSSFAAACATSREAAAGTASRNDAAQRLTARFEIEKAHVEAMTDVVPAFQAFYDSLTDSQKQALEPRRERQRGALKGQFRRDASPTTRGDAPAPAPDLQR